METGLCPRLLIIKLLPNNRGQRNRFLKMITERVGPYDRQRAIENTATATVSKLVGDPAIRGLLVSEGPTRYS